VTKRDRPFSTLNFLPFRAFAFSNGERYLELGQNERYLELGQKKKEPVSADSSFPHHQPERRYQQAGAPSWVTTALGEFAIGPMKIPQVVGPTVSAGFVIVAV